MTATGTAQTRLASDVVAAGAVHSTGTNMTVRGTIGQIIIGRASGSSGSALQGFWYRPAPEISAAPVARVDATTDLNAGPNPCNDGTDIRFTIESTDRVSICLFDLLGAPVRTILDEKRTPGTYHLRLNTSDLPSGAYTARLTVGDRRQSLAIIVEH
jgi:hypothetical protein